eukprot:4944024-Pyramimonas_sp.AAC.1
MVNAPRTRNYSSNGSADNAPSSARTAAPMNCHPQSRFATGIISDAYFGRPRQRRATPTTRRHYVHRCKSTSRAWLLTTEWAGTASMSPSYHGNKYIPVPKAKGWARP